MTDGSDAAAWAASNTAPNSAPCSMPDKAPRGNEIAGAFAAGVVAMATAGAFALREAAGIGIDEDEPQKRRNPRASRSALGKRR